DHASAQMKPEPGPGTVDPARDPNAGSDGAGLQQRRDRGATDDHRTRGGKTHPVHLHQARPGPGRPRSPQSAGGPALPAGSPADLTQRTDNKKRPRRAEEVTCKARGLYASSGKQPGTS